MGTLPLREFQQRLQPLLDCFVAGKTARYERYSEDLLLRSIWEYPRHLVAARGKRLRPYVAYLMFDALCQERDAVPARSATGEMDATGVLQVGCALELFHLFCLVHDDIIDQGQQRHALPTAHHYITARLRRENRLRDHAHIGNAQAMLLGDMLFSWSQEAFYTHGDFQPEIIRQAQQYFSLMIDEVVIGEMMDVDMTTQRTTTSAAIGQKMLLKTASYTFIRPMQIGAALAGSGASLEAFCYDLGLALGVAFQVQDDLLDLVGTTGSTQKTVLSDLREHQHTYFTQYIFDHGTPAQKTELRALMGRDLGPQDRSRVLELFESSGALSHGTAVIRRYLDSACALLERGPDALRESGALRDLICSMEQRSL